MLPILSIVGSLAGTWLEGRQEKAKAKQNLEITKIAAQVKRVEQDGNWDEKAVDGMASSFKDELILAWFLIIMSLPLIGETERFLNWAKVLSAMPSEIFYIFGAIVAASFGIKVSNIFKK